MVLFLGRPIWLSDIEGHSGVAKLTCRYALYAMYGDGACLTESPEFLSKQNKKQDMGRPNAHICRHASQLVKSRGKTAEAAVLARHLQTAV
jgi:hypothetical protein